MVAPLRKMDIVSGDFFKGQEGKRPYIMADSIWIHTQKFGYDQACKP